MSQSRKSRPSNDEDPAERGDSTEWFPASFPVPADAVTRRDFVRFLVSGSGVLPWMPGAFAAGAGGLVNDAIPSAAVATISELAERGWKIFTIPDSHEQG